MTSERSGGVFEVKFPLHAGQVELALAWMRAALRADPHGEGEFKDSYLVQSVYLDTPSFDVFHRRGSYGRAKFRIRRYGTGAGVFLERKLKREGVVRKRRALVDPGELQFLNEQANGQCWPGSWFHHRLALRGLRPVTRMTYFRTARLGLEGEVPFRITVDRQLRAARAEGISVPEPVEGDDLLRGGGLLEVKFRDAVPAVVRRWLESTGLGTGAFSKYRSGVLACGLVVPEPANPTVNAPHHV